MFKLVGHTSAILSIQYDINKDTIISSSVDKTIKIWDCLNESIVIDYLHTTWLNKI